MKCPHCTVVIHERWEPLAEANEDTEGKWPLLQMKCPACEKTIIRMVRIPKGGNPSSHYLIRPRAPARAPLSQDVPKGYAEDYTEACLVLADSPKASAALSRRCLQRLLRETGGVKPGNLSDEIDEVMPKLPSHLAEAVDAIRNIGNFAAHPTKDSNTGEIVEVEPGEAEWSLDVLEGLFDHYFVQPAVLQRKRAALDQKLQDAGKPPMK